MRDNEWNKHIRNERKGSCSKQNCKKVKSREEPRKVNDTKSWKEAQESKAHRTDDKKKKHKETYNRVNQELFLPEKRMRENMSKER